MDDSWDPWIYAPSLIAALKIHSDPVDTSRLEDLMARTRGARVVRLNPEFTDPDRVARAIQMNRLIRERDTHIRFLTLGFVRALRSGLLVARGIVAPVRPDSVPKIIPAHLWDVLQPGYSNSTASTDGLRYIAVKVLERDEISAPDRNASTISAKNQCAKWLRNQVEANSEKPWPNKKAAYEAAKAAIGPDLSQRSFLNVWEEADLPDSWRAPGPKPKR